MTKLDWSIVKAKLDVILIARHQENFINHRWQLGNLKNILKKVQKLPSSFSVFTKIVPTSTFLTLSMAIAPAVHAGNAGNQRVCSAQLQQEVQKIAQSPNLRASRIGVFVKTNSARSQVLANIDGDRYFIPSSNNKLFVTAAALRTLGADYKFTTKLVSVSPPNSQGELENGLWVIPSGDPSFSSEIGLKSLVQQLRERGVRRISGGIWTLPSRQDSGLVSTWEWSDLQEYYAAIASPLTINENALDWSVHPTQAGQKVAFIWKNPELAKDWQVQNQAITVAADAEFTLKVERPYGERRIIITGQIPQDSNPSKGAVAIPNPEENFLYLLRQELTSQGITVVDSPIISTSSKHLDRSKQISLTAYHRAGEVLDLAINQSPPLSKIVFTTNKDSNNLYAELLLRAIGEMPSSAQKDSFNDGIDAINRYLQSINIPSNNIAIADGSGLSRHNLTTPSAIVQLLQTFASDPDFRQSLPIAGVDGTLLGRFRDTPAQGIVQAKTGSMTGALALSGYAKPPKHDEVIFSIMINNGNIPPKELQQYIDAIALLLTRIEDCSPSSP